ncbi:MAG: hypothetical protein HOJ15_02170 [Candidatus Jacksonbacteria bacterium]|jgi:hypothetical protein|nr:hypothetical protein [Candidatus Jacksonbacteria bacterium]MBT6034773.1 hypothetical protein [Candidatus Jacksonbacteria bacterium]MBT6301211.1 hypothetical protein [Candidatus Jacksonbacteria bacterium]MBT6757039.1 hypothetical protein [Candidatus Jacksonbacteria bacterium]MBT6954814.1 hypothetical protein [Candidatus Jacksonbacteria bacterium]
MSESTKLLIAPGALFRAAWARLKQRQKTLLILSALYAASILLYSLYAQGDPNLELTNPSSILFVVGFILFTLLYVLIAVWAPLALLIASLSKETTSNVKVTLKKSLKLIIPSIGINIVMMVIVLGGYIAFIVPGIILAVQLMFALYVYVDENLGIMDSIRKSRILVRGRWWAIVGRSILLSLAVYALFIIAGIISYIIGVAVGGGELAQIILTSIVMFLYIPYTMCFMAELYLSLKESRGEITPEQKEKNEHYLHVWLIVGIVLIALAIAGGIAAGIFVAINAAS